MKHEELKKAVKEAIDEAFVSYGITTDSPHEMQQDMLHLRKLRIGCEATKRNILKAFIAVTIPAALYLIWNALKSSINGG